jgi:multidrug efflux system membrane fusion protein
MQFRRLAAAAAISAFYLILAGCTAGEAQDAAGPPPAPEVTATEVRIEELSDWAEFTGRLEAVSAVELRPRVSGYIEAVHFEEGRRVAKGDLLFEIDARPFRAEVARLTAERNRARAERELALVNKARGERLLAQNATSREDFDRVSADAEVAEATLAAVEAALESAELNLEFTRVTAPIGGRVSRAEITAGNLVDSSTLLTTLVSDDPMYVYFDVDEQKYLEYSAHLPDGKTAGAAYIGLINEEGYPHAARLDFLDNHVDPDSGTIRARAVLDNTHGRFTPGLFARVRLIGDRRYSAALVDDRAIGTDLDRKYVLVVDDQGLAQYRGIETGRLIDGMRVVTEGLQGGDVIIVNGLQRVRPGTPVAATLIDQQREGGAVARMGVANR